MAIRTIELLLHGDASQAIGQMEKLAVATGASADTMHAKVSAMASKIVMATAAAGIGIAAISVKLADDFESADAKLRTALANTGNAFKTYQGNIEFTNKVFEKLGYNNAQTETALSRLVTATGNVTLSQRDLGIAANIAAARHMDLNAATDLLVKTEGGRYVGLSKTLGVSKEVIAGFHSTADAVDYLDTHFRGQAAAGAETFQGKVKALQAQLEDIGVKIGQAVIPIIEQLAGALSDVIGWFEKNEGAAKALAIMVGTVLAGALAIFTYDKAVAFIGGLQRIGTAMGLMGTQAAEAGTAVGGAGMGGSFAAAVTPIGLVALGLVAVGYGLDKVFGSSTNVKLNLDALATDTVAQFAAKLDEFQGKLDKVAGTMAGSFNTAARNLAPTINATKAEHAAFNEVLAKTPQYASTFIQAIGASGQSTAWYTLALQHHNVAAEEARVATQRFGIEAQIADAKARGDTDTVNRLSYALLLLPTNPQIRVSMTGTADAQAQIRNLHGQLVDVTSQTWIVHMGIAGERAIK